MIISIDATGLGDVKTGTAVYLTEILKRWNSDTKIDHTIVIFACPKTAGYMHALGLDSRFSFIAAPDSRVLRVLWQQLVLPWRIGRLKVDVHWGCGFVLPMLSRTSMVVTIYDLTFQLFPSVHEPVKRYYFPAMIAAAVRKAKSVIAISQSTENDLHRLIPASIGKTVVTLLAPRGLPTASFSSPSDIQTEGPYIVCLGTLEPRKNLARLLEAWLGMTDAEREGGKLVVVGIRGWMIDTILARYKGHERAIEFTGFLDDAELNRLLSGATALAYPSLYEGFGLPVLEAMNLGVPVLTSDVGATKEISGGAALLVDPLNVNSIREALQRILRDVTMRKHFSELGKIRAAQFSWESAAQQTLRILERAASD